LGWLVKLTFIVVVVSMIGTPNQFQNLSKDFLLRYNLKRVDIRNGILNKGQNLDSPFNELPVSQLAMQASKATVKPFK
jgi:hypothetical protein